MLLFEFRIHWLEGPNAGRTVEGLRMLALDFVDFANHVGGQMTAGASPEDRFRRHVNRDEENLRVSLVGACRRVVAVAAVTLAEPPETAHAAPPEPDTAGNPETRAALLMAD